MANDKFQVQIETTASVGKVGMFFRDNRYDVFMTRSELTEALSNFKAGKVVEFEGPQGVRVLCNSNNIVSITHHGAFKPEPSVNA